MSKYFKNYFTLGYNGVSGTMKIITKVKKWWKSLFAPSKKIQLNPDLVGRHTADLQVLFYLDEAWGIRENGIETKFKGDLQGLQLKRARLTRQALSQKKSLTEVRDSITNEIIDFKIA